MLYDPAKNTHEPILSDWEIRSISLSPNGRLAFSSSREGTRAIYVIDYPITNGIPVKITGDTSTGYYPIAWSPDGRYLAYGSFQDNETTLSIWDGESSVQIITTSARISIDEFTWSSDGRLAFTIFDTPEGDNSEIFIWDGAKTVSLTQNPTGMDRYPAWSVDGHLAFLSERAGAYDIFIWDGTTTINGLPDVHSFSNIAPSLTDYNTMPVWSSSGSLIFDGSGPGDDHYQIYEWDGKLATNISQNPNFDNSSPHWRSDGYWSFGGYTDEQLIYIRDENNKTQLIKEGYGARWSESGYFIFCQRPVKESRWYFTEVGLPRIVKEYNRGWTLLLGNGSKITEIVQGDNIEAVWANGERVFCSSG